MDREDGARSALDSGFFDKVWNEPVAARPNTRVDATRLDETELIAAMVADDARAWREFQRRYDRLILRCITKVTRRFSAVREDDVQEIYSTLFVSLLANGKHKLRTFDPNRGNRFTSWIGLLSVHCTYDYLRTLRREPAMGCLSEAEGLACELPDPFEQTERGERAHLAAQLMEGLSERDRDFAELYFAEEMDPADIASTMNISVKTVYSKKHKIQARLGAILGKAGTRSAA